MAEVLQEMTSNKVVIVDYNMGNLRSVEKRVELFNSNVLITSKPDEVLSASKIILPGVGHFGKSMHKLRNHGLVEALNYAVVKQKTPVLGICLGMQLMCKHSEEGACDGLGWINAKVKRFQIDNTLKFKIPHTGWNTITKSKEHHVLQDIQDDTEQFFVHSYYVDCEEETDILTYTVYNNRFVSSFQKENIIGMQFHPEKSHLEGEKIIRNFISS